MVAGHFQATLTDLKVAQVGISVASNNANENGFYSITMTAQVRSNVLTRVIEISRIAYFK